MENPIQKTLGGRPWWKHPIVWILLAAFLLRLGSVAVNFEKMSWWNERLFAVPAVRMLEGKGLTLADGHGPTAYRPPLYIFWLAGSYALFGPFSTWGPSMLQALVSTVNVLLVYLLARRLWKREPAALVAAGILAVHPYAVWHDPAISYTFLAMTMVLASSYALVRLLDEPRAKWAALAGVGLGASILLAATVAPVVGLLLLAGLFGWGIPFRKRVALLCVVVLGLAGTWGVWIARNAIAFRAFVPLTTEAGLTLWYGNNPEAPWRVPEKSHEDSHLPGPVHVAYGDTINDCARTALCIADVNEVEENRNLGAIAQAWIMAHPADFLRLTAWRLAHIWSPSLSPPKAFTGTTADAVIAWGYAIWTTLIYAFAAVGAWALWHAGRRVIVTALLALALIAPSLYAVFLNFTRYRIPFEAILVAFAGGGVMMAWKRLRPSRA